MKTIFIAVLIMVTILVALGNVIPAFAKELTVVDSEGISRVDVNVLQGVFSKPVNDALSESEEAGLVYMREEEKLAHDVYVTLYQKWGLPTFNNIASSEATHTLAVKALLDRYGISDPSAGKKIGEFANPDLQGLINY